MTKRQKINLLRCVSSLIILIAFYFIPAKGLLKLFLFLIPYAIAGYDILFKAAANIIRGQIFDENFLMSLATVGAFAIGEYTEAVAVMFFYQLGELFQSIAVGKSRKSIAQLMDIRPDYANVLRDGVEITMSPDEVNRDEIIIIRPGEKIPLDGIVIEGATSVNTSALTGESLPRDVAEGDDVISGSINLSSLIKVKVRTEYSQSTVAKILELVENSASKKSRSENFITKFARYYTPCVVIGAAFLAVIPPLFFSQDWNEWINRALIFLVVSCPCALVISVPLSFFGGIGGASRQGILIKGSNYLEALSRVDTVVFDKTGTLTKGIFKVTGVRPENISEDELMDIAAHAESYSNHPIADSIVNARGNVIDKSRIGKIEELAGMGVKAQIDGKTIYAGNARIMEKAGAKWDECGDVGTAIHISEGDKYLGHIIISDEIKPDSAEAIKILKKNGVGTTVMLTGDISRVGEAVGNKLGIDRVFASLLPEEKVEIVEKLLDEKSDSSKIAFVGDGINDAPVLSRADVGIAMGILGSDAAIEAADVILMDDSLLKIPAALKISRKTMAIVKQNIFFSLFVKAVVLILGTIGMTNMKIAIFADVGIMLLAVLNAMRSLRNTD